MRWALSFLLLLFAAVSIGCNRPSVDECEEACVRMKSLAKADYDGRTADLPEEKAREGWNATAPVIDELVAGCTAACVETGDRDLALCLSSAKDAAAWKACLPKGK